MQRQTAVLLAVILFAAIVLRLGWALSRDASDQSVLQTLPDQREYLELGRNLLHRHELVMHDPRFDADVRAFRTPGYPMLIAACGGNISAIRIVQSLLDTSTVLAIFLLARKWLALRGSLLAAAIIAVNPFLIYFCALILSETFFIALLAWGIYLLTSRRWWIGTILLAFSVLVRPGALALPILLALTVSIQRKTIIPALVGVAMVLIFLFPWAWRNNRVVGRWIWTTTNSGFTMYDGFQPDATGASDQAFVIYMRKELEAKTESQRSDYFSGLALRSIEDHPLRAALLAGRKILRTWTPIPLSHEYGRNVTAVTVALLYTIPLFALTLVGLFRQTISSPAKILLMMPAIYFTVACAMSVGSLRYRLPADVPMAVVAASAVKRGTRNSER